MNKDNHVIKLTIQQDAQEGFMKLSEDGLVRMVFNDLLNISLSHLISINEETRITEPYTNIFGYTEWVSVTKPVISVGWDWKLSHDDRIIKIVRIGQPRSNIMLMDSTHSDLGQDNTEMLINQKIDAIAWEMIVKENIFHASNREDMLLSYS